MSLMDSVFTILRNVWPIPVVRYKGRRYAAVVRYEDVQEVLFRSGAFHVPYADKLNIIMGGGNIFLGENDVSRFEREKSTMRIAVPRSEAKTFVKDEVTRLANEVVDGAGGTIDVAMRLTQDVTTRFFGPYFGTPGPDVKTFSDWARDLFKFQFADFTNDPTVLAEAKPIAEKMRAYVDGVVAERKKNRGAHDDILERSLTLQDEGNAWLTDEQIRNNLIGFIVGGLPQPPMIIPQLIDVLLDRPAELAAAIKSAQDDDDVLFSKYLFEALRYNPLTPGLFRNCAKDFTVAEGTRRAKKIPAGTTVFAATRSAMFDGRVFPDRKAFRIDRPDYAYMHFGYGMHICFGVYINMQMVPAICKSLLRRGSVRRKAGGEGKLRMDGIFAKKLVVEYGT